MQWFVLILWDFKGALFLVQSVKSFFWYVNISLIFQEKIPTTRLLETTCLSFSMFVSTFHPTCLLESQICNRGHLRMISDFLDLREGSLRNASFGNTLFLNECFLDVGYNCLCTPPFLFLSLKSPPNFHAFCQACAWCCVTHRKTGNNANSCFLTRRQVTTRINLVLNFETIT